MKYLLTILALVIMSSLVTCYYLWPTALEDSSVVAVHNTESLQGSAAHQQGKHDRFTASLTRRVLVQEAQRLGIDKEESFRKSLKEYYEQSLVKVLTDRKLAEIVVHVSEEDVSRYLTCSGKMFTFTRFPVENGEVVKTNGQQSSVLFDDLSATLRLLVAGLQPGESGKQFETGTEISVIHLDKIETPEVLETTVYERSRVREQLEDHQRSVEIDRWINGLRSTTSASRREEAR